MDGYPIAVRGASGSLWTPQQQHLQTDEWVVATAATAPDRDGAAAAGVPRLPVVTNIGNDVSSRRSHLRAPLSGLALAAFFFCESTAMGEAEVACKDAFAASVAFLRRPDAVCQALAASVLDGWVERVVDCGAALGFAVVDMGVEDGCAASASLRCCARRWRFALLRAFLRGFAVVPEEDEH